jgi:hypothetical protein
MSMRLKHQLVVERTWNLLFWNRLARFS